MERPYLEIVGSIAVCRRELDKADLCFIGEFTRENILAWTDRQHGADWVAVLPVADFHAVCGDIDIPWATEEARSCWMKCGVRVMTEKAYIEIVGDLSISRWNLNQFDLRVIGDFTRWRVAQWLYNRSQESGISDFHAVCGDIDIPWDTEAARSIWMKTYNSQSAAGQPMHPAV
jgi:hypothetical protein